MAKGDTRTPDPKRSAAARKGWETRRAQQQTAGGTESMPETSSGWSVRARFAAVAAIVLVGSVVGVLIANSGDSSPSATAQDASTSTSMTTEIKPSQIPNGHQPSGTEVEQSAATNYLLDQGYTIHQFSFKVKKPVYQDRGAASISPHPILSLHGLKKWIKSGSERSKAYLTYAKQHLSKTDYRRVKHGQGFVRVQLLAPSNYIHGSYFDGGKVVGTTTARSVGTGDIVFLYVDKPHQQQVGNSGQTQPRGQVDPAGNTRGPCGNIHEVPVPARGQSAPPISVPVTTSPPAQTTTTPPSVPPATSTVPSPPSPSPTPLIPKGDTPTNTPGPTGNGIPQPPSDTQPIGGSGSTSDNNHTGTNPPPPTTPPSGSGGGTAGNGGHNCGNPTCGGY